MSNHTVTGVVLDVHRLGHTVYGNPIMSIDLWDGRESESGYRYRETYRISDNTALVYEIANPEFRNEPHTFVLTRAGRISRVMHDWEFAADCQALESWGSHSGTRTEVWHGKEAPLIMCGRHAAAMNPTRFAELYTAGVLA